MSPDSRWIYATDCFSQSVSILDRRTNAAVGAIAVGGFPVGVAVKP